MMIANTAAVMSVLRAGWAAEERRREEEEEEEERTRRGIRDWQSKKSKGTTKKEPKLKYLDTDRCFILRGIQGETTVIIRIDGLSALTIDGTDFDLPSYIGEQAKRAVEEAADKALHSNGAAGGKE